jgi:membrane carboxypeptidase/penicillin-binding protein
MACSGAATSWHGFGKRQAGNGDCDGMIRLIGTLFSMLSNGAIFAVGGLAGLVYLYGGDLPAHDELVSYHPKMLSRVYSGEGQVIAEFYTEKRVFVPVDEIPELVKNAFISAEDKNFYTHPGVDAVGKRRSPALPWPAHRGVRCGCRAPRRSPSR